LRSAHSFFTCGIVRIRNWLCGIQTALEAASGELSAVKHIAIIGSGPAGYYTAEAAQKLWEGDVRIDIFDRLQCLTA